MINNTIEVVAVGLLNGSSAQHSVNLRFIASIIEYLNGVLGIFGLFFNIVVVIILRHILKSSSQNFSLVVLAYLAVTDAYVCANAGVLRGFSHDIGMDIFHF